MKLLITGELDWRSKNQTWESEYGMLQGDSSSLLIFALVIKLPGLVLQKIKVDYDLGKKMASVKFSPIH